MPCHTKPTPRRPRPPPQPNSPGDDGDPRACTHPAPAAQSVHAPNEAPAEKVAPYLPRFPNNTIRAIHAGALACLDDSIGEIMAAVTAAGLDNDTLVVLHADNGGPLGPTGDGTMASNYPLRSGKHSLFQGGVRVAAFAWGSRWLGAGVNRTWPGLAHVSDVGLSLLEAAGVAPLAPLPGRPVTGSSFFAPLTAGAPTSLREELVVNVDYTYPAHAAIVMPRDAEGREWKLILGWPEVGGTGFEVDGAWSGRDGLAEVPQPGPALRPAPPAPQPPAGPGWPLSDMTPTLYDLASDPRELNNISTAHPDIVAQLTARLAIWGAQQVAVVANDTIDPRSNPSNFNGSWTPWLGVGDDL